MTQSTHLCTDDTILTWDLFGSLLVIRIPEDSKSNALCHVARSSARHSTGQQHQALRIVSFFGGLHSKRPALDLFPGLESQTVRTDDAYRQASFYNF